MAMDPSRLHAAADLLDQLAVEITTITDIVSERAEEVADRIHDVAAELRSIADKDADETEQATLVAVEDETGAVIEEKPQAD